MENEVNEIKKSIYAGMSIYTKLERIKLKLSNNMVLTQEDKKYLSLYLGVINTNNKISKILNPRKRSLNIEVKFNDLDVSEYTEIYKKSFYNILIDVNFDSLDEYTKILLSKEVVQKFNEINDIKTNQFLDISNKQLVKK